MDSVQSLLPKVLRKRGLFTQATASHVVHATQEWLDGMLPNLAGFVHVDKFSHGVITVSCTHSIAAQECRQILPMLLEHLKREHKQTVVQEVMIVRK